MITINLSVFTNNRVYHRVVFIRYYILASELTLIRNTFIDNRAASDVFISSDCKLGFILSFGSPRCIKCPKDWHKNFVIIVIANTVAGI